MFLRKKTIQQRTVDLKIYLEQRGIKGIEIIGEEKDEITFSYEKIGAIVVYLYDNPELAKLWWFHGTGNNSREDMLEYCNELNIKYRDFKLCVDKDDDVRVDIDMEYPENGLYAHIYDRLQSFVAIIEEEFFEE